MKEIKIGSQIWAQEDLKVLKFKNGDLIPIVQDAEEWSKMKSAAMCINPYTLAYFYNWYAVNDSRGLAPEGWHVPTDAEWTTLTDYLGATTAGGKMKFAAPAWNGTNESGFCGLPGGARNSNGSFLDAGNYGHWWSSSPDGSYNAWTWFLSSYNGYLNRSYYDKRFGFSVRCIKGEVVCTANDEHSARLDEIALKLDQLQREIETIRASKKP